MFVDDISAKDALVCIIIRSPAAKGKIRGIRCPPLEEGCFLVTAADIPGVNRLPGSNMPVLAEDSVSYYGEPVALLAVPELGVPDGYFQACSVETEEEEPDFSLRSSGEEPPPEMIFYRNAVSGPAGKESGKGESGKNKAGEKNQDETLIAGNYETRIQEHWYTEPHGALAEIRHDDGNDGRRRVIVKTSSQDAEYVRQTVAQVLNIGAEDVEVENFDPGIHFDGKLFFPSLVAALAALAAYKTKRAVKLRFTRNDDYLFSPKRTPSAISISSLTGKNGEILETSAGIQIFCGAYAIFEREIVNSNILPLISVYKLGRISVDAFAVKKNIPPAGPFAGFGTSIASYALERHIAHICDSLGEDGVNWRLANIRSGLKAAFGLPAGEAGAERGGAEKGGAEKNGAVSEVLEKCAGASDYRRKWAAYELLRRKHLEDAGRILPVRGIGLSFAVARGEIPGNSVPDYAALSGVPAENIAACVVETEINKISYEPVVRHIWFFCGGEKAETDNPAECGRPAEKIIRRSIVAALGWASTEKADYTEGKVVPDSSAFYHLPAVSETPEIHIGFAGLPGAGPVKDSALEELPFSTIPAAFAQAVTQATDYHFCRIPITGEDIWNIMKTRRDISPL